MNSPEESAPLRIRSAGDLIAALRDPHPMVRVGVLQQIACQPDRALAYGRHEGADILDVLIEETEQMPPGQVRQLAVIAVANFRDARAIAFLMRDLPRNHDTRSIMAITVRLGEEATEPVRRLLLEMMARDPLSAHARTAAGVLAWWPDWTPTLEERLRVALVSDVGRLEPPPFDDDSADAWLGYLRGPTAARAWLYLERQGRDGLIAIGRRWDDLDDGQRLALVRWGGRDHIDDVAGLLPQTLAASNPDLVLEALGLLARLAARQTAHMAALRALWDHPRLDVRCAALRAGLVLEDWPASLDAATDLSLRREILAAFARHCPVASLPHVMRSFEAPEWQMRATAVQLAIEAGPPAVEALRRLASHERAEVRIAACQALLELGEQQWLEETFL